MTAQEFAYWLQGFMEIQDPEKLNKVQTQIIKDHLALVFNKVTPDRKGVLGLSEEELEDIKKELQASEPIFISDLDTPQSGGFIQHDCQVALC